VLFQPVDGAQYVMFSRPWPVKDYHFRTKHWGRAGELNLGYTYLVATSGGTASLVLLDSKSMAKGPSLKWVGNGAGHWDNYFAPPDEVTAPPIP
jgi:hypothetical protein